MTEDARPGVKGKASTKFTERTAKALEGKKGLGKLKPWYS
jgi:hypothetical protein